MESLVNHLIALIGKTEIGPGCFWHVGPHAGVSDQWTTSMCFGKKTEGWEVKPYPQPLQRSLKISRIFSKA